MIQQVDPPGKPVNHIWGHPSNTENCPPSEETLSTWGRSGYGEIPEIPRVELCKNNGSLAQVSLSTTPEKPAPSPDHSVQACLIF